MSLVIAREVVSKPDAVIHVERLIVSDEYREAIARRLREGKLRSEAGGERP